MSGKDEGQYAAVHRSLIDPFSNLSRADIERKLRKKDNVGRQGGRRAAASCVMLIWLQMSAVRTAKISTRTRFVLTQTYTYSRRTTTLTGLIADCSPTLYYAELLII